MTGRKEAVARQGTPRGAGFDTLRSPDPGRAVARLSSDYTSHRMHWQAGAGFDFVHMTARIPQGSFNILRYGPEVEIRPQTFGDFYMLEMPLAGGVRLTGDGAEPVETGQDMALFIPPDLRFTSVWRPGTVQVMLKLRAAEVRRRWQQATGETRLPPAPPGIDLTTPEGWRVREMFRLLQDEAMRAAREDLDLLSGTPLAGALIDSVLAWLRRGRDSAGRAAPLPASLRRVLALIEERLAEDLSVAGMAAAAGISERSVFNLFAGFLDTTPMAHVAERRLVRARGLLQAGGWTAAAAARAAGIQHPGRFARAYRDRFGEMPSDTARQAAVRKPQPMSGD